MQWEERGPDRLRFSERDFKVCDFCGTLNPTENAECFVCNWRGLFRTDRETVGEEIRRLEADSGGLNALLFTDEAVPSRLPRPSVWDNLRGKVRKLFKRA